MIVASHQPNFLPYMGFFYKAAKCDVLVFSDDVQFSKKGMHNWNRIKALNGEAKLTLPVHAHHDMRLADIKVSDAPYCVDKIVKTLEQNYCKANCFEEGHFILEEMELMARKPNLSMVEFNVAITELVMEMFRISPEVRIATRDLHLSGHKDDRIFMMCEELGATEYLSGTGAAVYHRPEEYARRGVDLVYSDYRPIKYQQLHGKFIENLSVIDYIFNMGFDLPEGWLSR